METPPQSKTGQLPTGTAISRRQKHSNDKANDMRLSKNICPLKASNYMTDGRQIDKLSTLALINIR